MRPPLTLTPLALGAPPFVTAGVWFSVWATFGMPVVGLMGLTEGRSHVVPVHGNKQAQSIRKASVRVNNIHTLK